MPKAKRQHAKRRSREQVQQLIDQVNDLVKAGEPLMKSLDKLGVSYSNYNYWIKKRGGSDGAGSKGRGRPAGSSKSGVFSVLDEMRANRAQKQELEKQIRTLDVKFNQLKFKLSRT